MTRLRSLVVSLVTTLLDVGLFALSSVVLVGVALPFARWACGALGAICNFLALRRWAFHARGGRARQALRYAAVAALSVTLGTVLWWTVWRATGLDPRLLHVAALGVVWLIFTFPLMRGWVFAGR